MAETITLTCDQCGAESEVPTHGWISLKPARKSEVLASPPAKGDFCSTACLNRYVNRMEIQRSFDDVIGEASRSLGTDEDEA